ncbi:hypothetical protein GW17_00018464 [Ensete ventricosum]|nr:hypothetical protein GW17_00018464 [Ensete ventricosum]
MSRWCAGNARTARGDFVTGWAGAEATEGVGIPPPREASLPPHAARPCEMPGGVMRRVGLTLRHHFRDLRYGCHHGDCRSLHICRPCRTLRRSCRSLYPRRTAMYVVNAFVVGRVMAVVGFGLFAECYQCAKPHPPAASGPPPQLR